MPATTQPPKEEKKNLDSRGIEPLSSNVSRELIDRVQVNEPDCTLLGKEEQITCRSTHPLPDYNESVC